MSLFKQSLLIAILQLVSTCYFVLESIDVLSNDGSLYVHKGNVIFVFLCTALVALTNEMLARLHVEMRVRRCGDMNSLLFITLFEGLCAEPVKGI